MYPRLYKGANKHRQAKRVREIEQTLSILHPFLKGIVANGIRVLEFGCGNGFQLPYLKRLGKVFACDIEDRLSDGCKESGIEFCKCSIENVPFDSGFFNVIFSNHVLEHIDNYDSCFSELKRIGAVDCVYAFVVPTSLWLLLSVPGQYYMNMLKLFGKDISRPSGHNAGGEKRTMSRPKKSNALRRFVPLGHGKYKGYFEAFTAFKKQSWQMLFENYHFKIEGIYPLLLYGPSEWPLVPTTTLFNKYGFTSSILFIMKKKNT